MTTCFELRLRLWVAFAVKMRGLAIVNQSVGAQDVALPRNTSITTLLGFGLLAPRAVVLAGLSALPRELTELVGGCLIQ